MRSTPHGASEGPLGDLSGALRVAVADLVGCGLNGTAWEQATLPISKGGLGVRDPEQCVWAEARVAALVGFHCKATDLVGLPREIASQLAQDTTEVLAHLVAVMGQGWIEV